MVNGKKSRANSLRRSHNYYYLNKKKARKEAWAHRANGVEEEEEAEKHKNEDEEEEGRKNIYIEAISFGIRRSITAPAFPTGHTKE